MNPKLQVDIPQLNALVKTGLIVRRDLENLSIYNYTNKCQFSQAWDEHTMMARGLIVDRVTGEVVALPFPKFFNWLEGGRTSKGHIVTITEKIDGSIGILFRFNGKYQIATRGSFDGPQAVWATEFLQENYDLSGLPDSLTLLFEIVYPKNRIVLDYGQTEALYLLAARNRFTGAYLPYFPDLYELGHHYNFPMPKVFQFNNLTEILEWNGRADASTEGFVVEFSDGQRFKFKNDRYMELARMVSNLTYKHAVEACRDGLVEQVQSALPDEFLGQWNLWVQEIESKVQETIDRVKTAMFIAPRGTRKQFAMWAKENYPDLADYLFSALDERDLREMIFKYEFRDIAS